MKIWLLLPAFNEAENLPPLLESAASILGGVGGAYQVIVVDDGSSDGTAAVAKRFGAGNLPVTVVRHGQNRGLAQTIETALRAALAEAQHGDVIVTMDADNTHSPTLIPMMLEALHGGADLVIASRYAPGGAEEGVPPLRRFLSQAIGLLLRMRFGLRGVRDYSSGYRAYSADLLRLAAARYGHRLIESRGFTVMTELLLKLAPFHPTVAEVPLRLRYDLKRGGSKMRLPQTIGGYLGLLLTRIPSEGQVQ